jgi:secreted trypsin-like serine protease
VHVILAIALSAFAGSPTTATATSGATTASPGRTLDVPTSGASPVVGGQKATEGQFPDVAGIAFRGREDIECSGTLVAPTLVLTAGHCADGITGVRLDASDYSDSNEGEYIKAKAVYEYPNSQRSYDVTAIVLATPAKAKPRPIAMDCIVDDYLVDGAKATIAGYGAYDQYGNRYDSNLRDAEIEINDADCNTMQDGCQRSVSPGGELSAGGDGTDTCYGDSGGPLYLHTPKGDFLAGITSRSYAWVDVPCRDGGIYVRPDAIVDWLETTTGITLDRPDCSTNAYPEPTADDLVIAKNRDGSTKVFPNDPDDDQTHTFEITAAPAHGAAVIAADGTLTVTPERGFEGDDTVTVTVTDNGDPARSADLDVPILVLSHSEYHKVTGLSAGCGCDGAGLAPGWLAGAFGLLLLRRRR